MRDAGCEALVGRAVPASRWARCSTKLTTKLATKFGNGDHIDRIDLIDKRRVRPCFAKTLRRTSGRALPFFLQTQVPRPDASTPSGLTLLFFMVRKKQEAADRSAAPGIGWTGSYVRPQQAIRFGAIAPASLMASGGPTIPHHASRISHPASNHKPHPNRRLRSRAAARNVATMPAVPGSGITVIVTKLAPPASVV